MANANGWGDGASNNNIGWGKGADNAIGWGDIHADSYAGLTDIVGTASFSNTKSILLDGIDDFVDCSDNDNLSFGDSVSDSPFSISAWIKFDNTGSRQGIVAKFNAPNYFEYTFFLESDNTLKGYLFDVPSTNIRGKASTVITTGVWNYVTFTYDGQGGSTAYNGMKIYLNGVDVSSSNVTLNTYTAMHNTSASLKIGQYYGNYAIGNIDEVSIFNTELSASDVTTIYNGGVPNDISSLSPVSWWRCGDGDTSPTLTDNGSGGNDGTMTNFSTFSTDVPT